MKKIILSITSLLLLFIAGAEAQTVVSRLGQLSVQGSKIQDQCGRTAQLKGMSYFWHFWGGVNAPASYRFMNTQTMKWLRDDWKVEIVRIPISVRSGDKCSVLGTQTLAAGDCQDNPTGITGKQWGYNTARTAIQAAVDNGLYIVVDWHAHPSEKAAAKEFFTAMAQEFGQYPNVIYEIYNEPTGSSWENLDQTWPQLKEYSRDLIATIRQYDPDNLIICPTPFYDQFVHQAAADPITVDINNKQVSNIAYSLHVYADAHRFDGAQGGWAREALSKGLPMFVTESGATGTRYNQPRATGINAPNYTEWAKWENWWDQNGISFCKWSMSNKDEFGSSVLPRASTTGNWNYNTDLTDEGRWNRDHFRDVNSLATVCNGNPGTGNVTVRARGSSGSEQIEIRYNDQRVGDRITLSTTYQEYKVQVNNANGNFKVAFVNDNGPRDAEVDWLQVGTTKRQAETRSTNTAVWQNNSCGGSDSQLMNCNGYIGFGTMSDVTSGNVVIRARGNCGSETMVLEVGGSNVKTWNNLGTSYANYTYSGYSGGTIKVKFTNNQSSPCDRNLYLDYIEVCGKRIQSESSSVVQTSDWTNGDKQVLFTDGNNNYGNPGCGSARTSSTGTKLVAEPAASEWGEVFNLYPNPATDQLTVEGGEDYQVTLYDLTGRKVMQHDHLKGSLQLNISHVRPGLYVVKMRDGEQHEVSQRIVVE